MAKPWKSVHIVTQNTLDLQGILGKLRKQRCKNMKGAAQNTGIIWHNKGKLPMCLLRIGGSCL